jgi:hypothetical protein
VVEDGEYASGRDLRRSGRLACVGGSHVNYVKVRGVVA